MAEAHIISKVIVSGDIVEVYTYSSGIKCGHTRDYDIVRQCTTDTENDENEKRLDNLSRARQNLRRIVWANQTRYTKFLTLTYAKTELDTDKVLRDIKTFVQRMRRNHYEMKYVYVLENQKSRGLKEGNDGCLHVHMLIFNDEKISLDLLNTAWSHGFTDISALRDIKDVGAYVCKYITKDNLQFYNKHVYGCSRGLNRGVEENFYAEGYSDHRFDGFHYEDVVNSLDLRYSTVMHRTYRDDKGVGHEQKVTYYQGTFKDINPITDSDEYEVII